MRLSYRGSNWLQFLNSPVFKFFIAASIIGFLIYGNKLSLNALVNINVRWPWLLLAFLLTIPPFFIVAYRFTIILLSQGIRVPYYLSFRWTMIGAFFDLLLPSSNAATFLKQPM